MTKKQVGAGIFNVNRFAVGDTVKAKASNKLYRVVGVRTDGHRKLKGEIGYDVVSQRGGKNFGPIRLIRESSLTIALLLAAMASANAQGIRDCLANAASEYKRSWLSHCPGGVQYNFPACQLPPHEAAEAKLDWATARGLCFENHNAEAIDRADEMQRVPGLTRDEPELALPADSGPRRKFWISPQ